MFRLCENCKKRVVTDFDYSYRKFCILCNQASQAVLQPEGHIVYELDNKKLKEIEKGVYHELYGDE